MAPPIDDGVTHLTPVLKAIEERLAEYIPISKPGDATRLFVSQLTREHLRKTLSFFLSVDADQTPVPFQDVGTGTLNALVLALLSFVAELKTENVIFAMEEPEIALPPHTQRRIARYLLDKTTQSFVTSHSPYIIECFDPERILILRRHGTGDVAGQEATLGATLKAKMYRRHVRRGIAEAMLGRGVIVTEGLTEQVAIQAAAATMEKHQADLYPLDLSGVTVFSADGDGSVAEFGRFFISLGMPTFAFLDKKVRPASEENALATAGFNLLNETAYLGMEALLATEVPIPTQWKYLEGVRNDVSTTNVTVPATIPGDAAVRGLTTDVLKSGKGWGRAADLIEHCDAGSIPVSISDFLMKVYIHFPRPKQAGAPPAPTGTTDSPPEAGVPAPPAAAAAIASQGPASE